MKLVSKDEFEGKVTVDGVTRTVSLMLLPDAKVGDWVLVHAGFAIGVVDESEAMETLELMRVHAHEMTDL